jgi:pentatricopeptide repeat protein
MRGLVDRRAVAILSRSRGPGAYLQRLSFSAGRGRGRGDIENAPIAEFGAGSGGGDTAPGAGLGLGSFGTGRGRGRGNALPSPPVSSQQPIPFKPFTLRPTEASPGVVAEKSGSGQQSGSSEVERRAAADSRFEDAVADVKPSQGEYPPLGVSSDARQERPGFSSARQGAGRGLPVSREPSSTPAFRNMRQSGSNADRARATAWGSLSQLLAGPGRPAAQPAPVTPPAGEQPKQSGDRTDFQEPAGISVGTNVVEEGDSPTPAHLPVLSSSAETSQKTTGAAGAESPLPDASYVAMIKYHQGAGRLSEVDQIYEEMQADSVPISIPTYNLLIQIFSQAGQFDKMDKVYKQMRQALTQAKAPLVQAKEDEQTPAVEQATAPDVPVTLEEQVVVKSSADQVEKDTSVTQSDELSARLGEWDDAAIQPPVGPGANVEEDATSPRVPSFKLSTSESPSPADDGYGRAFAQDVEESKKLMSFRGLLNIQPPGASSDGTPRKGAFNPFNLPTTPSPSIFGGAAGRGRGVPLSQVEGQAGRGQGAPRPSRGAQQAQVGAEPMKGDGTPVHVQPKTKEEREQARERAMALLAKGEEQRSQRRESPPAPARSQPQLSREDAVQRAVAVMNEGVERNLTREEEKRRRRGAVDSFSDATTMVADRFRRRAPESAAQQARGPQTAKDRLKRQPRSIRRRDEEEEPQVPLTLREMTEEDEERLTILEEEEQFKSSLHSKFLVDFEPEYAMEYFGLNPDIDELPQKPLEEILAEAKPYLMMEGMTDEQWDGEVKDVLEKAPHLENLVSLYAGGPSRLTAKEQSSKLQAVAETMPAHVAPEIQDFMSQAMLSLQSNPGIRMREKERLMNKFVSGLSSF